MAILTLEHKIRVSATSATVRDPQAMHMYFAMEIIREVSKKVAECIDFTIEGDDNADETVELTGRVRVVPGERSLITQRASMENGQGWIPDHHGSPHRDMWEGAVLSAIQKYQKQ